MKKCLLSVATVTLFFVNGFAKNNTPLYPNLMLTTDGGKGNISMVELGYSKGVNLGIDFFKFNFMTGYKFNPFFSLQFGFGARYNYDKKADVHTALIPFFTDLRAHFIDKSVAPYLSLIAGYTFNITDSFSAIGFLLNPVAGVSFNLSEKSRINAGIGYDLQNVRTAGLTFSGISFNAGISF